MVLYISAGFYLKGTAAEVIIFYALGIVKSKWDPTGILLEHRSKQLSHQL